jgi:hypothetical protein
MLASPERQIKLKTVPGNSRNRLVRKAAATRQLSNFSLPTSNNEGSWHYFSKVSR